jgi:CRP-like cAMP-binding protein
MTSPVAPTFTSNRLLANIPAPARESLASILQPVTVQRGEVLIEAQTPPEYAFFPESSVCSIVADAGNGVLVEAAAVGKEGFVGLPILNGQLTTTRAVVQVAGRGLGVPAEELYRLQEQNKTIREALIAYSEALFDEVAQSAACNATHGVDERAAKMLLLMRHRLGQDTFGLTHQYLATMLGVRRAGVTVAALRLQRDGIIRYARGVVTITNPSALAEAACNCYHVIAQRHRQLEQALLSK